MLKYYKFMYNPIYKHLDEWNCLSFGIKCKILNVCTSLSGLTQITNANFEWFLWILHSCHFKFSAWALRRKYCLFREQMQECCHKCKYCDVGTQKKGGAEEIANQVLLGLVSLPHLPKAKSAHLAHFTSFNCFKCHSPVPPQRRRVET